MITFTKTLDLKTSRQFEILDITAKVQAVLRESKVQQGIMTVFSPHTTSSIHINHHEPLLLQDFMKLLYRLAPLENNYAHDFFEIRSQIVSGERSNGHAHLKAFMLGSSESIPVRDAKLTLGVRQSIFFVECDGGRKRNCIIQVIGE